MKGLTLHQAVHIFKHENRRFRRLGEDHWNEVHEGRLIRVVDGNKSQFRSMQLDDALANDWEIQEPYRHLCASEIKNTFLDVIQRHGTQKLSPMEYLMHTLKDLDLL